MSRRRNPPPFSWSNSRHKKQQRCPRLLYLHHYLALGGYHAGATEESRRAFLLKQLVTLDILLGGILHDFAREFVIAIRDGCTPPTREALLLRARASLNAAYVSSLDREAYLRNPRSGTMLREIYCGHDLPPEAIERIASKLACCIEHLCASAVWDDLARCRAEDIITVDALATFVFEGTLVYAAPDLAYTLGGVTIVDWKTGDDRSAAEQILVYALFLRDGLRIPYQEGHWFGRVINLREGTDVKLPITSALLDHAAERMRSSIREMRGYLADPEQNIPKPKDAFPLIPSGNRKICDGCNFLPMCSEELEHSAPPRFTSLVARIAEARRPVSAEF